MTVKTGAQRLSASQRSAPPAQPIKNDQRRQVLNAFRHHRGRHAGNLCGGLCPESAQRLSASQRSAQRGRHQLPTRANVLNAFRHHRGRHFRVDRSRSLQYRVLNAFRHHRGRHVANQRMSTAPIGCSTPFGITEVGTWRGQVVRLHLSRAQRLSASQRSARMDSQLRGGLFSVLNAFRHHRGRHAATSKAREAGKECSTPFGITEVGTSHRQP